MVFGISMAWAVHCRMNVDAKRRITRAWCCDRLLVLAGSDDLPLDRFATVVASVYGLVIRKSVPVMSAGWRLAEDAEHRGRDVAQRAAGFQAQRVIFGDQNKRHGIGGVIGVRAAGDGIDHGFGVAVIGGDDPGAAARLQRLINSCRDRRPRLPRP